MNLFGLGIVRRATLEELERKATGYVRLRTRLRILAQRYHWCAEDHEQRLDERSRRLYSGTALDIDGLLIPEHTTRSTHD